MTQKYYFPFTNKNTKKKLGQSMKKYKLIFYDFFFQIVDNEKKSEKGFRSTNENNNS